MAWSHAAAALALQDGACTMTSLPSTACPNALASVRGCSGKHDVEFRQTHVRLVSTRVPDREKEGKRHITHMRCVTFVWQCAGMHPRRVSPLAHYRVLATRYIYMSSTTTLYAGKGTRPRCLAEEPRLPRRGRGSLKGS